MKEKRDALRFNISFEMISNHIDGQGVNISEKGIGFLFSEELVPADNIPFKTVIKGEQFEGEEFLIEGKGRLLFSNLSEDHNRLYYNGFEFIELTSDSEDNLKKLLQIYKL